MTIDTLSCKAQQLSALMCMITTEGWEAFTMKAHCVQLNYLWACYDMAKEIELLAEKLTYPGGGE